MKLSISQLTFNTEKDFDNLVKILKENNIFNIELVLSKIISWDELNMNVLEKYIEKLNKSGFKNLSTQSITYNTSLKSFCDDDFVKHIFKVSDICVKINTEILVLGSPKLRDKIDEKSLSDNFKLIDSYLKNNNQILCIEPNCSLYGGNYFFTLNKIVEFLVKNNFSNIKTMIDTHNIIYENLNPAEEFLKYQNYISHIHISEYNLKNFINSKHHEELSNVLKQNNYSGLITYEVMTNTNSNYNELIESIINFNKTYN